jgi:hypothetical protein
MDYKTYIYAVANAIPSITGKAQFRWEARDHYLPFLKLLLASMQHGIADAKDQPADVMLVRVDAEIAATIHGYARKFYAA